MGAGVGKIRQKGAVFVRTGVRAAIAIVLPVSQSWVLSEQAIRSVAFDKKVIKIKKAGRIQSQIDRLCSAFNLFQASDHLCKTLFNVYVITRKTK